MAVRNFYDEGQTAVQFYIVNDVGKLPAEFLSQEDNPVLFVSNGTLQGFPELSALMNHAAFHTGQSHSGISIHVITDEIHFHGL